jgi:hypothetical protein
MVESQIKIIDKDSHVAQMNQKLNENRLPALLVAYRYFKSTK